MRTRTIRAIAMTISVAHLVLILPAALIESSGVSNAFAEGELEAAPMTFLARFAILALLPLALCSILALLLPNRLLIFSVVLGFVAFLIVAGAAMCPRNWRVPAFPTLSDTAAWENAQRQVANENLRESTGRSGGKIIWYIKRPDMSVEQLAFLLIFLWPLIAFAAEIHMRNKGKAGSPQH